MQQGIVVWISEPALCAMRSEASAWSPRETGGVLVGYATPDLAEYVITAVVGPGSDAKHRRRSFVPDTSFHEREIARLYEESHRTYTYLGDWHSHPGGTETLSFQDRCTLALIARTKAARIPSPLMAILHGSSPWALAVWVRRPRALVQADVNTTTEPEN
jgi:integrative and conjugative element protein (TIGR02256 family)